MSSVPELGSQPEPTDPPSLGQEDVLGRRISAAAIDLALLIGLFIVLALAIGESTVEGGSVSLSLNGGAAAVYFGLVLLYYFALEAIVGRTLGKLLLGLRVVQADGSRPSVAAIALRTLLRIVDWLPLLYLVGFITMMATGQRRQRLGDLAARTAVARAPSARRWALGLPPVTLLLLAVVALSVYRATESGAGNTGTPRPAPTGAVLYRDTFSNTRSGWYVGRDRTGSSAYVHGRYRTVQRGGWAIYWENLDRPSRAVSVTAVLAQSAGGDGDEFGVACLKDGQSPHGYALGIGPSDAFVALRRYFRGQLFKESYVAYAGADAVKRRDAVNRIRADCFGAGRGSLLRLYANGVQVGEAPLARGVQRFDSIGVYIYDDGGGMKAVFDDVVVRELKRTD